MVTHIARVWINRVGKVANTARGDLINQCFVCFLPIYSGRQVRLGVPAGVTQEEGHTGFLIHLLSTMHAFISREEDAAVPF